MPADGDCAVTIDPVTLLHTGLVSPALTSRQLLPPFLQSEYGRANEFGIDAEHGLPGASGSESKAGSANGARVLGEYRGSAAHTFAALARRLEPVSLLSELTGGHPERSARYRDVLRPAGYRHELSAVLRDGRDTWGAFTLWRDAGAADFTADEVAVARAIVPPLAEGVRRALLRVSAEGTRAVEPLGGGEEQPGPGLVLLTFGSKYEFDVATSTTADWLDRINDTRVSGVPSSLVGAAMFALSQRHELRFQLCSTSGQWLEINVTPLSTDRVAMIIQPGHPWASARIIARAYGLSPRERDVALLVLRGRPTKEIAGALYVSPYTVQDHLKRIFHKTGARSRAELVGRVFFGYFLPRQADRLSVETPGQDRSAAQPRQR